MSAYRGQVPQEVIMPVVARESIFRRARPLRLAIRLGAAISPLVALIMFLPAPNSDFSLQGWGWEGRLVLAAILLAGAFRAYMTMLVSRHTWP